jgi:predicted unusual protein kinase regulating ubiquinone biosynthesis (AarF/ABC1/UbiB family)
MGRAVFKRVLKGNIDEYFEEIRDKLLEETDYINEGKQINFFAKNYNTNRFATPEWIEELSSDKVLTMSFLQGKHLKEFLATNPSQEERNNFGQLLWDFFHEQIQRGNMIHADTHPGNFLFLDDGRLGIIDFGCVKNFPPDFFELYLRLLPTHLRGNKDEMRQLYIDMEILREKPEDLEHEAALTEFCFGFGDCFALPYRNEYFDFGNREFEDTVRHFIKTAPRNAEVRGSRHFIFSSRVQIGLYRLLTELECKIRTDEHIPIVERKLAELQDENKGLVEV